MNFDDYLRRDAVDLAALVRSREVTPDQLLSAALARNAAVNPSINAVVATFEDLARADIRAGLPNGPLTGVPFLVKDLRIAVKGTRTTAASRTLADAAPAAADSPLAAAYRAAGIVFFGKTNTPEFGLNAVTEPALFGVTRNPWNPERTAGGSSGGAAAAVAAGIVPAAHGSDGGGSLRIPASACCVFAMKPTRGRISMAPDGEGWGGMATQNVISRSVRDSAVLMDASCRPVTGDPYWRDPPADTFLSATRRVPDRLRIAFSAAAFLSGALDPECADAVRDAARLCESFGHDVEEATPEAPFAEMAPHASAVIYANIAATLESLAGQRGRPIAESEVEHATWLALEAGRRTAAPQYVRALNALARFTRGFMPFFDRYDVLITSTLGQPPIAHGSLIGEGPELLARLYRWMPNTNVFNVTGQPAMSVPLAQSKDGLPIGIQFAARPGEEALLFGLAAQLEAARPWAARVPVL